jgi:hypothetical protein
LNFSVGDQNVSVLGNAPPLDVLQASHWFTEAVAEWFQKQVKVGSAKVDAWNVEEGFDWASIGKVRLDFWPESGTATGSCWVDALFFGGNRYNSVQEDAGSHEGLMLFRKRK